MIGRDPAKLAGFALDYLGNAIIDISLRKEVTFWADVSECIRIGWSNLHNVLRTLSNPNSAEQIRI
jgi:hypothetical protein